MQLIKTALLPKLIFLGLFLGATVPVMALASTTESSAEYIERIFAEADIRRSAMTAEEQAEDAAKSLAILKKMSADIASGKKIEDPIEAQAKQGDANAQYLMGVSYFNGYANAKDYKKAFEWTQKSASQGYAKAQYNLANMYHDGKGVRQDKATAKEWFGKACDNGNQMGCDNYRKLNH